jgi:hypothetical protein
MTNKACDYFSYRSRNRTPAPPPLSSMNATPAASSAARMAMSLGAFMPVLAWGPALPVAGAARVCVGVLPGIREETGSGE